MRPAAGDAAVKAARDAPAALAQLVDNGGEHRDKPEHHDTAGDEQQADEFAPEPFRGRIERRVVFRVIGRPMVDL